MYAYGKLDDRNQIMGLFLLSLCIVGVCLKCSAGLRIV